MNNTIKKTALLIVISVTAAYLIYWLSQSPQRGDDRDWDANGLGLPEGDHLQIKIDTLIARQPKAEAVGVDIDDPLDHSSMDAKLAGLTRNVTVQREPTEQELNDYYLQHREQYRNADYFTLRHRLFSNIIHGGQAPEQARQALTVLNGGEQISGDRSAIPPLLHNASSHEIDELFGGDFSRKLFELVASSEHLPCWSGPITAANGAYLVCIEAFRRGAIAPLSEIRLQVINDWRFSVSASNDE